jgi:hypothetical protein
VVRTRARGFDRHCPHGVFQGFQITSHKSEPVSSTRNLLSKDRCRASLGDKAPELWPEVPVVSETDAPAGKRERLTRARSGPDGIVIAPSGISEGEGPSANPGKEMALAEPVEFISSNIDN